MSPEFKTTLDYARWYISKGFSVIPLKPKDKKPAIETWKVFQTYKPTDDNLKVWFGNGSDNNIAVVTGEISGIAVVDFDSPEAIEFSKKNNFPITPLVKTGKGYHAYYQYKEGVRNFQKRDDLPGIDLRGDGGYVVAPPSIHKSGKQYQWVEGNGLDDLPLAELPEIVLAKRPEEKTPLKELYKGIPKGSRNDSLARVIGSLVNDGLSFDECLEFAYQWNERNNPPETDLKEIERTVKSIFEKHHRELSYCPPLYSVENTDNTDNAGLSRVCELDLSKALRTGRDLQILDIPIRWAVKNFIPLESITLLPGKGGMGKTTIAIQGGDAISRGVLFLGHETIQRPVIYIDFENSLPVLIDRIRRIGAGEVSFWHTTNEIRPPRLDSKEWVLYKQLPQGSVLIFDTLRAAQSRDENDSQHMAFIMQRLKELRDLGYTIILLHHTPKSNERIYKGSTAIFDLSDHVLGLYKVRKGNHEEIDEDDDTGDYCYRLGTRDKTRYEPYHVFLEFDKSKGIFRIALDPDTDDLEAIQQILEKKGELNQSQIFEVVKEELNLKSKSKLVSLLRKGNNKYWKPEGKGRAVYYSVLSYCPGIYRGDNKTIEKESVSTGETIPQPDTSQSLDSSILSNCPDDSQTEKTDKEITVYEVLP